MNKGKRFLLSLALMASICIVGGTTACKGDTDTPSGPSVNSSSVDTALKISQSELVMDVGDRAELLLKNAGATVIWESANAEIATVENGAVTAKSYGTTEIVARTETGTVSCIVKVQPILEARYALQFETSEIRLYVGSNYEVQTSLYYGNEKVNWDSIEWSSSNGDVVSVSENGLITGTGLGKTIVTAVASVNGKKAMQNIAVTVIETAEITLNNESLFFTAESAVKKLDVTCKKEANGAMVEVPTSELDFEPLTAGVTFADDGTFTIEGGGLIDVAVRYGESVEEIFTLEIYDNLIRTPEQFLAIANNPNGYYMLMDDIDFGTSSYTPIASFGGVLNGNGFSVKNVTISVGSVGGSAMFTNVTGKICNVSFENVSVNPWAGVMLGMSSTLVKALNGGTLENVYVSGAMKGPVAGVMSWGTDYRGWNLRAGTLLQQATDGVLRNVVVDVSVDAGSGVKSLLGSGNIIAENVYTYASQGKLPEVGGTVKVVDGSEYVAEDFETAYTAAQDSLDAEYWNLTDDTFALNACSVFRPEGEYTVKIMNGAEVIWETTVRAMERVQNPGKKIGDTYILSYDFDFNRRITQNTEIQATALSNDRIIKTTEQFLALNGQNGGWILGSDIDFGGATYNACLVNSFTGTLDGNGYSVKNLTIASATDQVASFGVFQTMSGTIRNMGFENITLSGWGGMHGNSGIVAVNADGATLENIYISGSMELVNAKAFPWADYTTWGFASGFLASSANGANVSRVFCDVKYKDGTDISCVAGKGTVNLGDYIFNNAYGTLNNWGSYNKLGWAGTNTGDAPTAMLSWDSNVWSYAGSGMPSLKENCTLNLNG